EDRTAVPPDPPGNSSYSVLSDDSGKSFLHECPHDPELPPRSGRTPDSYPSFPAPYCPRSHTGSDTDICWSDLPFQDPSSEDGRRTSPGPSAHRIPPGVLSAL